MTTPYERAQRAIAELKGSIYEILLRAGEQGLSNAQIGRSLGIYAGHIGHQGHIPRTMLALMENEGVAEQIEETKRWRIKIDVAGDEPV
jgi:hypothetical protein